MNTQHTPTNSGFTGSGWAGPDSRIPYRVVQNDEGFFEIWTRYNDSPGTRNNYAVATGIQHMDEAHAFCTAVNSHDALVSALRDILDAYHGLTLGRQDTEWEGQFKVKARAALAKAGGAL